MPLNMTFTKPRATLEETLAFANAVREAGGGNPLDALMPAVPSDAHKCLIARNLNFNCSVKGLDEYEDFEGNEIPDLDPENDWFMHFDSAELRDRVADTLGLRAIDSYEVDLDSPEWIAWDESGEGDEPKIHVYAMQLPPEIGAVAEAFDHWMYGLSYQGREKAPDGIYYPKYGLSDNEEAVQSMREFAPFIEASVRETRTIGVFNEKGELIL